MLIQNPKNEREYGFYEKPHSCNEFKTLPAGIYNISIIGGLRGTQITFEKKLNTQTIVEPTKHSEYLKIKKSLLTFFNPKLKELYSDLKYLNKKGILIHGKPGTGKTASVSYLSEKIATQNNGIVLEVTTGTSISYLPEIIDNLRKDSEDKEFPILLIMDECENYFTNPLYENILLNFLDGYNSRNNIICIFITNKIEKIPKRFTERPSRIRDIIEYSSTPFEVIREILDSKIPDKYKNIIDIEQISYTFSNDGKTIDQAKTEAISMIEDFIVKGDEAVDKLVKS